MDDKLPDPNNSFTPQQPTQPEPLAQTPSPNPPNFPDTPIPPIPSNPSPDLIDPVQSELAKHQKRDAQGHFIKSDYTVPDNPNPPISPNIPDHPDSSYPAPIQVTQNDKYSENNDPPMVDVKVTNPVTYFKKWIKHLLGNEGIDIGFKFRIKPMTAVAIMIALAASFGTGYTSGLNSAAGILFPNSSPILHRAIVYQGTIQKTQDGQYYLSLPDTTLWKLLPKSQTALNTINNSINKQVMVKGNLTREANVINVSEINIFDSNK